MLTIERDSAGELIVNVGKLPADLEKSDWNFSYEREWGKDYDANGKTFFTCAAAKGGTGHIVDCECFFSKNIPGWVENIGDTAK